MNNSLENNNKEEHSFESALGKLEIIVKQLDQGNQSLDETLALYEEGIRLFRFCNNKLEYAQQQINIIQGNSEIPFHSYRTIRED